MSELGKGENYRQALTLPVNDSSYADTGAGGMVDEIRLLLDLLVNMEPDVGKPVPIGRCFCCCWLTQQRPQVVGVKNSIFARLLKTVNPQLGDEDFVKILRVDNIEDHVSRASQYCKRSIFILSAYLQLSFILVK